MTWRELWQNAVANLRALLSGRSDAPAPSRSLPDETAPQTGVPQAEMPQAETPPTFPTVWEAPSPAPPATDEADIAPPSTPVLPVEAPADTVFDASSDASSDASPDTSPDASPDSVVEPAQEPAVADPDTSAPDDAPSLSMVLESVLFVASEPVTPAQLARSLQVSEAEIDAELAALAEHYRSSGRGLRLQLLNGKVQLVTAPAVATYVEAFLNLDATSRLSGPALETLAVVAYRQPVTRAQVEAIRGVDCASVLRSLVQRGLVSEVGRLESAGRPILYGVTEMFMQHFGLSDLKDLPPLEESEADRLWAASLLAESD